MENDLSLSNKPSSVTCVKESFGHSESGSLSVRELVSNKSECHNLAENPVTVMKSDEVGENQPVTNDNGIPTSNNTDEASQKKLATEEITKEDQTVEENTNGAGAPKIVEASLDEGEKEESMEADETSNETDEVSSTTPKKRGRKPASVSNRLGTTIDSMYTTYGTGTLFSEIPHIVEFVNLNNKNDNFLKMLRRFLFGTIGTQSSRAQEVLIFNGFPSGRVAGEDSSVTYTEILMERIEKLSVPNIKILCELFNIPFRADVIAVPILQLVDFVINPAPITESIVKPYVIESETLKTPSSTRRRPASSVTSEGEAGETPAKRAGRRGRPKKNLAEDSTEGEDELSEGVTPATGPTGSGKKNLHMVDSVEVGNEATPSKRTVRRTVTIATDSTTTVNEQGDDSGAVKSDSILDGATPVKRGRGRPPKSAKTPQSATGDERESSGEIQASGKSGRSSIIHPVE